MYQRADAYSLQALCHDQETPEDIPERNIGASSKDCSGSCAPVRRGVISLNAMALGAPSTTAAGAGAKRVA